MRRLPRSVSSPDPNLSRLLNLVLSELRAQKLRSSPTIRIRETENGTIPEVVRSGVLGTDESSAQAIQMKVLSVGENTLTCKEWDGEDVVGNSIQVAKPYTLRQINDVSGATWLNGYSRTQTVGGKVFTQEIWPNYTNPGQNIIYAVRYKYGSEELLGRYVDLNVDGRAWALVETVCHDGVPRTMRIVGSIPFPI